MPGVFQGPRLPGDRRLVHVELRGDLRRPDAALDGGQPQDRDAGRVGRAQLDTAPDFLRDWSAEDVRRLGELLARLETSVAAAKKRPGPGRRWQREAD